MSMMVERSEPPRSQIGPYQILAKIGEGGMGIVHLTRINGTAGFNKLVVVKELQADKLSSLEFVEMFLNEARLAARLTHPNVVHTYEANEHEGRLYLAMEYLDGQSWSRIRQRLSENDALPLGLQLRVLIEVLAGLHYAHELRDYDGTSLQVVHCDVSPPNVFVTYDGQVKIVDFGIARAVTAEIRPSRTKLIGKLQYLAPEQARSEPLDRRADLFAVGVMLWEALAGKRFAAGGDWKEAVRRRSSGEEPRIREVAPAAPSALADVCDRALALAPSDRFASAAEMRDALLRASSELEVLISSELGERVAKAFQPERASLNALIHRNLKHWSRGSNHPPLESLVVPLRPAPTAQLPQRAQTEPPAPIDNTATTLTGTTAAGRRLALSRRTLVILGAAASTLLAARVWVASSEDTAAPRVYELSESAATAPPEPVPQVSALPLSVRFVVSAHPPETTLFLDGEPLDGNPVTGRLPANSDLHVLRASAPGMHPQERIISFERDLDVSFALVRARWSEPRKPKTSPVQTTVDPPPPAPTPTTTPTHAERAARVLEVSDKRTRRSAMEEEVGTKLTPNSRARPIYTEDPSSVEEEFGTRPIPNSRPRPIYTDDPYR